MEQNKQKRKSNAVNQFPAAQSQCDGWQARHRNIILSQKIFENDFTENKSPFRFPGSRLIISFTSARAAESSSAHYDFALKIDAFAAFGADHARTFEPGQVFGLHLDLHPLLVKEHFVGERGVRFLLSRILAISGNISRAACFEDSFAAIAPRGPSVDQRMWPPLCPSHGTSARACRAGNWRPARRHPSRSGRSPHM